MLAITATPFLDIIIGTTLSGVKNIIPYVCIKCLDDILQNLCMEKAVQFFVNHFTPV